ncbi:tRNA-intron lyase [Pyrofollis japonicus]|uniref:tRNA-intron lyase n=1 Tax=Pyrofollis japonicus TaxID=3060460 RepID=UPI00295B3438|nr:tRNA-intron lyase [Pyrofollis japonicus]BEP18189.1 tRNA-intron lyase [Pyrofollis japonicus]
MASSEVLEKKRIKGRLLGLRVIIFDVEAAQSLYKAGFYGKPLGIPKPRSVDFNAPLELSLVEALYLLENNIIEIIDENNNKVDKNSLIKRAESMVPRFRLIYKVYKELRDQGYIVRSGLKFGADFAVYEKGPGIEHAPYLVHVLNALESIDPLDIVRAGRLSHSVRKAFIIAIAGPGETKTRYLMFRWSKL